MHPETTRTVAARQVEEMHAVARAARLATSAQAGGEAATEPVRGADIGGRSIRLHRLLGRRVPGRAVA